MIVRIVLHTGLMTETFLVSFMEDFNLINSKQVTSPTVHTYEMNDPKGSSRR